MNVPSTTDIDDFFMDADNTVERKFDFGAQPSRKLSVVHFMLSV
jgi:hypothetical protein